MKIQNFFADALADQLVRLATDWLDLRAGLSDEAAAWHWDDFRAHVRQAHAWRLLRAGLPTEPERFAEACRAIEDCLATFRREGRVPPAHLYVRQLDEAPTLEIQAAMPLAGDQGAAVLAGDRFCIRPKTLLGREDVAQDRATAAAALQRAEPTDERGEMAREFLLEAVLTATPIS